MNICRMHTEIYQVQRFSARYQIGLCSAGDREVEPGISIYHGLTPQSMEDRQFPRVLQMSGDAPGTWNRNVSAEYVMCCQSGPGTTAVAHAEMLLGIFLTPLSRNLQLDPCCRQKESRQE